MDDRRLSPGWHDGTSGTPRTMPRRPYLLYCRGTGSIHQPHICSTDCLAMQRPKGGDGVTRVFPLDVRQRNDPACDNGDPVLADLGKWRVQVRQDFTDLFVPVPQPGEDDFRILTDPTAKILHRQPYRMTAAEREELRHRLQNFWLMANSHSRYAAPVSTRSRVAEKNGG